MNKIYEIMSTHFKQWGFKIVEEPTKTVIYVSLKNVSFAKKILKESGCKNFKVIGGKLF